MASCRPAIGRRAVADGVALIWQVLRQRLWIDPQALKADYSKSPPWLRKLMQACGLPEAKVRAALQTRLGVNVRLHFEQGDPVGQTVAQRLNAEQRARHEQACASMKNDPFVQQVIEQFGARLIEDSIKPL